jgi:hypothetical protein
MQYDLNSNYPDLDLDVSILGVNAIGHESGNAWFTSVSDLPWLQDVDASGDGQSDVWANWQVVYRDVIILDAANVPVGRFNLTDHDLQDFENYDALRRMFIEAATLHPLPGDYNDSGVVEQADLDLVLLNWGEVLISPGEFGWTNDLPVGPIDQEELDGGLRARAIDVRACHGSRRFRRRVPLAAGRLKCPMYNWDVGRRWSFKL